MVMVNVLFLCNYLFISKLRKTVDNRANERDKNILRQLEQRLNNNWLAAGLRGFRQGARTQLNRNTEQGKRFRYSRVRDALYAFFLGKARLEPSVAAPFPNWQPIPYKLGIISTSSSLLLATLLLSGDILLNNVSSNVQREDSTGLCANDDFDVKIENFKEYVLDKVTNYNNGRDQKNATLKFRDALLDDTTLYGNKTEGFECPNEQLGSKEGYKSEGHADPFFPGYCQAALDLALKNAKSQTCTNQVWICVDDWGACIIGKWVTLPITCGAHTFDAEIEAQENYRAKQRETRDQEEFTIESIVSEEDLGNLQDDSADLIKTVLRQIDIAGTLYSIYICVALFFPTPLILYRPSLIVQIKGLLFGAGKYTFIATVLIIWWGHTYARLLLQSPELNIYLKNFASDPCFLDGDFISKRYKIVQDACADLINFENEWGLAKIQIDQIKPEVAAFSESCNCHFPGNNLLPLFGETMSNSVEIGFDNAWKVVHGRDGSEASVWSPRLDSTFLGNETICIDRDYARQEVLVADETDLSLWELWISSGLLANLLVKIAIANFGIALLKLADPFCICEGTYESPPTAAQKQGEEQEQPATSIFVDNQVKADKAAALKAIAMRESLIWGFITNSCLLSLLVVAASNFDGFKRVDYIFFGVTLGSAFLLPFGCFKVTQYANEVVDGVAQEQNEDVEGKPIADP